MRLPEKFTDVAHLEDVMTTPAPELGADLNGLSGDILILGVGGKMGPTLTRLARRAAPGKRVLGVARFTEPGLRQKLEAWGVECIACDLLEHEAIERLPKIENVVFMAGRKFGSSGREDLTWAMNVMVPAQVAEAFRASRIVAFSTACVYPYMDVASGGATEAVPAIPPSGDYANSCVGRERMFEYFSRKHGTRGRFLRLEYAIDMRYGVLHDVGRKVFAGTSIDLTMGHVNVIWQGDANAMPLRALAPCTAPASALNVSGPETVSVRALAEAFGRHFNKAPVFTGKEAGTAWLVNSAEAHRLFGRPSVPLDTMIAWQANWIARGGASLGKDTHFDARDGKY
jgi:nucleoside-diphosphate-sugar epimerase